MTPEEREQLIDALLDGDLSEAEFLRLEAEMLVDPEARAAYYERLQLHTLLETELEAETSEPGTSQKVIPFLGSMPSWNWFAVGAAACFALVFASLGWMAGQVGGNEVAEQEPVAQGYAVIAETADAQWDGRGPLSRGDLLPLGPLKLANGLVQLNLFSGVTVIVEGEAEFEILSSMEMQVKQGRVRAQVPEPAQGFRIRTAGGDVVDLGTEFALDVSSEASEIQVLDGEVEWHPQGKEQRTLLGGQTLRQDASGQMTGGEFDPSEAGRMGDLELRLMDRRAERRQGWLAHSKTLATDPRTLVYFPMADSSQLNRRQLLDQTVHGHHGTIVAAHPAADRWGREGCGLDFSPAGSRVRLHIPGEHGSITFYCWTRIDSLDRWYNSLFLTDGHELLEPHWQIMDTGELFFSVKAREIPGKKDKLEALSPSIWNPAQSGRWMQLAAVFDMDSFTTTHYVNGEAVSVDSIPRDLRPAKVEIGAASIGNWSEPKRNDPHFAVRNLNGVIDEFAIFSGALSAAEIQELYELGKP